MEQKEQRQSVTLWYHTDAQDILSPDDPYWDRGNGATDYFGRDTPAEPLPETIRS